MLSIQPCSPLVSHSKGAQLGSRYTNRSRVATSSAPPFGKPAAKRPMLSYVVCSVRTCRNRGGQSRRTRVLSTPATPQLRTGRRAGGRTSGQACGHTNGIIHDRRAVVQQPQQEQETTGAQMRGVDGGAANSDAARLNHGANILAPPPLEKGGRALGGVPWQGISQHNLCRVLLRVSCVP
jgi:hypothetical protein